MSRTPEQAAAPARIDRENDTAADFPHGATVPTLFAACVARAPHRVAVTAGDVSLTYRALDRASNQLARYLRGRGIGAGALVGVCLDRSAELVVALLGIMKAGAAYVPLDPGYPAHRLAQVIEDAALAAILTMEDSAAALPAGPVERILLDRQAREIAAKSRHRLDPTPSDQLAYVIFTSGSTGRPKGVRIRQRSLVNLLWGMAGYSMDACPGLSERDVLLAVTTIAFDIAALELFLPLVTGARVVIAPAREAADGHALAALLTRSGATLLQATPATWQLLLDAGWRGTPGLTMLCGGEALSRALADRLLATGEPLWNMYGPTETTIWSSCLRVTAGTGPVRIGPPMANTTFHVLDDALAPVPAGEIGELFIGGEGVAEGYCNRPDLTAERFLPDPFRPGGTLYRTGDLVRRHPSGGLAFHGRRDQQIKLRGFRIELGEIEAALLGVAGIGDGAVGVRRSEDGTVQSLDAFVEPRADCADPAGLPAAVQAALSRMLPAYMRPSTLTVVDRLPRTPNGKLDRAALASAQGVPSSATPRPRLVSGSTEVRLAAIWADVLGLPEVGPDDNFFALGGHSLLAARMLAEVEGAFGRRLPLAVLFRAPTPRALAASLDHGQAPQGDYQLVAVQESASGIPIFAINHPWLYQLLAAGLGPAQPFYALQVFEPDGPERIETTAARLVEVIRHVRPHGPYILLGLCSAGSLAYEAAQQLRAGGEEVPLTVLVDAWAPDYYVRLSPLRAWLADWSYRAQMLAYDFRRDGAHSLLEALRFSARRGAGFVVKHSVGLLRPPARAADPVAALDAACDRYRPRALASPLLVFHREEMPSGRLLDPHLGWDVHAARGLRVVALPGDHFDMFRGAGADRMAQEIKQSLESSSRLLGKGGSSAAEARPA